MELIPLSNRWVWAYSQIMTDYLQPAGLSLFINPLGLGSPFDGTFNLARWGGGYHEVAAYIGLVPFLLALGGITAIRRHPVIGWFWGLSVLFTLLALGDSTAFSHGVFQFFFDFVPGFSRNRSVGRIMVLTFFCLSCAAGLTLESWSHYWQSRARISPRARFTLATVIPILLILFTLADLWQFGRPFIVTQNKESFSDQNTIVPSDVLEEIQKDPGYPRLQPKDSEYMSFELMAHVSLLSTYSLQSIVPYDVDLYIRRVRAGYDSPLSDLISLKYLYAPDYFYHPTQRWKRFKDEIVINTQALPRAYVVGGYELTQNTRQAIESIKKGIFDIRSGVLLEQPPGENFSGKKGWIAGASITRYDVNEMDFTCQTSRPGIFFSSDPYYPGWKAWVDGVENPILKADGVFRALVLDQPGRHQIKFLYQPPFIYFSLIFSAILWLILLFSFVFAEKVNRMTRNWISW
jgi:hypothetical protein